jgi:acyl carrier protein
MRFDPARWVRAHISGARSLLRELQAPAPSAAESASMLARLRAAAPEERRVALETHLREHVAHVLRVAPSRIDRATSLKNLGLNSLMSLELRNRIEVTLGLTLPATLVWNYPTVAAMAAHLVERLGLASGPDTGQAEITGEPELEQLLAEIQGLSDDEVRRLLAEGRTGARDE